jgi:hypothetical protein
MHARRQVPRELFFSILKLVALAQSGGVPIFKGILERISDRRWEESAEFHEAVSKNGMIPRFANERYNVTSGYAPAGPIPVVNTLPVVVDERVYQTTKEQRGMYIGEFQVLDVARLGIIGADTAVPFFSQFNLPKQTLSSIWNLADISRDGKLDVGEFIVARHLVELAINNIPVPAALPPCLIPPTKKPVDTLVGDPPFTAPTSPIAVRPPPPVPVPVPVPAPGPIIAPARREEGRDERKGGSNPPTPPTPSTPTTEVKRRSIIADTGYDLTDVTNLPYSFPASHIQIDEKDELGSGSWAVTFKGRYCNAKVACKNSRTLSSPDLYGIKDNSALFSRAVHSFIQECEVLSLLRHPNVVLFIGMAYDERTRLPKYIVTECCDTNLFQFLQAQRNLPLSIVLYLGLGIAKGLSYIHSLTPPIAHRDLSSKNILIQGYTPKIADLGSSAQSLEFRGAMFTSVQPGAQPYMPPEALGRGEGKYNELIDIYSFGILLMEIITGTHPSELPMETYVKLACERQPSLAKLIKMCCSPPSQRPNANKIVEILEEISGDIDLRDVRYVYIDHMVRSVVESELRTKDEKIKMLEAKLEAQTRKAEELRDIMHSANEKVKGLFP